MIPKFPDLFGLMLADVTPAERTRFAQIAWRTIVTAHIAWACGLLAPFGLTGFVFADDVDSKIEEAIEPIQAQLGAIATQITVEAERSKKRDDEIDAGLKAIRTDQISAKLRDLTRTYCLAGTDKAIKERMNIEIERAQLEYRKLTGERYPLPDCDEFDP